MILAQTEACAKLSCSHAVCLGAPNQLALGIIDSSSTGAVIVNEWWRVLVSWPQLGRAAVLAAYGLPLLVVFLFRRKRAWDLDGLAELEAQ